MVMCKKIGQYFTKDERLQAKVLQLCKNSGAFLEPSAGEGHLVSVFEKNYSDIVALELDSTLEPCCKTKMVYMDFFDYPYSNRFDTIFGNPPYLKNRMLSAESKEKMDEYSCLSNCNIFYNFIEKSFFHLNPGGELIFIIPREFTNSTRAIPLRELLFKNGTITDFIDYEEEKLFKDAAPNIIVIRYEKHNLSHKTNYERKGNVVVLNETLHNGSYLFVGDSSLKRKCLSDFFDIKVGIVSGLNSVFERESNFAYSIICSDFLKTGKRRIFTFADDFTLEEIKKEDIELYNYLLLNKELLMSRKIKNFDESNWYHWGAVRNLKQMQQKGACIYVNAKTREQQPFFVEERGYYDGSILALYAKDEVDLETWENFDLEAWCDRLNNSTEEFKAQGLYVNNKYNFSIKTLSDFLV